MLVLDSNELLPPGWADLDLETMIKSVLPDPVTTDGLSDGLSDGSSDGSDGGISDCQSDDGIPESLNDMEDLHQSFLNDSLGQSVVPQLDHSIASLSSHISESSDKSVCLPQRVLVFTTPLLLGLLSVCKGMV